MKVSEAIALLAQCDPNDSLEASNGAEITQMVRHAVMGRVALGEEDNELTEETCHGDWTILKARS